MGHWAEYVLSCLILNWALWWGHYPQFTKMRPKELSNLPEVTQLIKWGTPGIWTPAWLSLKPFLLNDAVSFCSFWSTMRSEERLSWFPGLGVYTHKVQEEESRETIITILIANMYWVLCFKNKFTDSCFIHTDLSSSYIIIIIIIILILQMRKTEAEKEDFPASHNE